MVMMLYNYYINIITMPTEISHSNSSDGPLGKHKPSGQKLSLPPIQCKWKKDSSNNDSLSNLGRKITPQTDSNFKIEYLKSNSPLPSSNPLHRGILKSSISYDYLRSGLHNQSNPSIPERKKVSFIDEVLNKPLAEYNSGDASKCVDKKKKVCACITF
jgi:hypothetical protein